MSTLDSIWTSYIKACTYNFYAHYGFCIADSCFADECVSDSEHTILVTCKLLDQVVGHAFASTWSCSDSKYIVLYCLDTVGWITQLVVDKVQYKAFIATSLLQHYQQHPNKLKC